MLIYNRLLIKARKMTYTKKNIQSAFQATGIVPVNERLVLSPKKSTFSLNIKQPSQSSEFLLPLAMVEVY